MTSAGISCRDWSRRGMSPAIPIPAIGPDASTIQAYWDANMSLLAEEPALNLYAPEWVVHTRSQERAPVKLGPAADVDGTLLSNGCQIEGAVERSVLSPGVQVGEGALVRDSVILNDTIIEPGAVVERCVIDKEVRVCQDAPRRPFRKQLPQSGAAGPTQHRPDPSRQEQHRSRGHAARSAMS